MQSGQSMDGSAAEEVYVQLLAVATTCYQAVSSIKKVQQLLGLMHIPGNEIIPTLLDHHQVSQSMAQL